MAAICNGSSLFSCSGANSSMTKLSVFRNTRYIHMACRATVHRPVVVQNPQTNSNPLEPQEYQSQEKLFMKFFEKLENIKHLMESKKRGDPMENLILIDAIQRLGIEYHFQEEIGEVLQTHYKAITQNIRACKRRNLYDVSLSFRLLREQGYHVPADVFNEFKGNDGSFKGNLRQDIRGLMELYEAGQVGLEGEYILDEAANFSGQILDEYMVSTDKFNNPLLGSVISNTLKYPYHKSIAKLTAKNFTYRNKWGETLKQLADFDSFVSNSLHRQELLQVTRWWDNLGLATDLHLARNQPIKWYTWSMAALTNPSMSHQRIEVTKAIAFVYLVDDIFDLYGTIDELTRFTEAVKRWDYAAIEELPNYMKMTYKALLDTTSEVAHTVYKKRGFNPIDTLKEAWADLFVAFLVEAKWFSSKDSPTAKEYLKNGISTSGAYVVLVHMFCLLDVGGMHLDDAKKITTSTGKILRLWDDLGSAKDEHQNGNDGSYINYYKEENQGCTVERARKHVMEMISNEWKCVNKEYLRLNQLAAPSFTRSALNLCRMVQVMYSYDDSHRLPLLEEYVKSTLLDDMPYISI